jgi:4-amino-4-deoxy-L-arabinose transferase-like glycosyltransferase
MRAKAFNAERAETQRNAEQKAKMNQKNMGLGIILAVYLALGVGYALRTPPWQNPDEPAHYNYVAQVAESGCCPVIEAGDWDQDYLSTLTASRFDPALLDGLAGVQYEDHQPPLFYLMGVLPYQAGDLLGLRLLSVVLGAGAVVCAYVVGRLLLPDRAIIALIAAGVVAFVPQRVAMMASANNDALAELLVGLALVALIHALKTGRGFWLVGLIVGAGFLTKITVYGLAGAVGIAVLIEAWAARRSLGTFIARGLWIGVPALALGAIWWARNLTTYGGADFLGLAAHDAVVIGQLRTADLIAQVGTAAYWQMALTTTFQSFWGQFGWMALPLDGRIYTGIGVGLLLALLGALLMLPKRRPPAQSWQIGAYAGLIALTAITAAQVVYYNLTFVQFQGRYLYPALIPVALALAYGWDGLARRIRLPWGGLIAPALLVGLNLFVLWRVIPGLGITP